MEKWGRWKGEGVRETEKERGGLYTVEDVTGKRFHLWGSRGYGDRMFFSIIYLLEELSIPQPDNSTAGSLRKAQAHVDWDSFLIGFRERV